MTIIKMKLCTQSNDPESYRDICLQHSEVHGSSPDSYREQLKSQLFSDENPIGYVIIILIK